MKKKKVVAALGAFMLSCAAASCGLNVQGTAEENADAGTDAQPCDCGPAGKGGAGGSTGGSASGGKSDGGVAGFPDAAAGSSGGGSGGASDGGSGSSGSDAGVSGSGGGSGGEAGSTSGSGGSSGASAGASGSAGGCGCADAGADAIEEDSSVPPADASDADASDGGADADAAMPVCGNNARDSGEACDGIDLAGQTCLTIPGGYSGGTLKCKSDCSSLDTTACTIIVPPTCGDGACNGSEDCISCSADCGACAPVCGNNLREGSEVCDGSDLAGKTCETISSTYGGGTLTCKSDCGGYIESGCFKKCHSGDTGTTANYTAKSLGGDSALLIHFLVEPDYYATPATGGNITGKTLPGQLLLAGKDSAVVEFKNSSGFLVLQTYYRVDLSTVPSECKTVDGPKDPVCLKKVDLSFRCQYHPELVSEACPMAVSFIGKTTGTSYSSLASGWQIVLADFTCP